MKKVLFVHGKSKAGVLEEMGKSFQEPFAELGLEMLLLDRSATGFRERLDDMLEEDIDFAFGFAGIGQDIVVDASDEIPLSIWEFMKIPFISIFGDSPAYYFDLHRQSGTHSISLYGCREHLELRQQLPFISGELGLARAGPINPLPKSSLDFEAKKRGKIIFLKNGNSPQALVQFWDAAFNEGTRRALFALQERVMDELDSPDPTAIHVHIENYFQEGLLDPSRLVRLKLLLVAQLDDYLRRIKSEMVADVLLDYPTEVRGLNWAHLKSSGRVGRLIESADFLESNGLIRDALALIDMSPNTGTGFHDRQARAAGSFTLCLSNDQPILREVFPEANAFTYRFNRKSIAERVEATLAEPAATIELGIRVSEQFNALSSRKEELARWRAIADLVKTDQASERPQGAPPYLMWPPSSF